MIKTCKTTNKQIKKLRYFQQRNYEIFPTKKTNYIETLPETNKKTQIFPKKAKSI